MSDADIGKLESRVSGNINVTLPLIKAATIKKIRGRFE
jgi:hypothetical protein